MKYQVFVDDNFHYMDEDERYLKGEYDTLEEAIIVAKKIVDDFLENGKDDFDNADDLHSNYRGFGEDPFIMGAGGGVPFSAWKYARERCEEIYAKAEPPVADEDAPDEVENFGDDEDEEEYDPNQYFPLREDELWFTDELKKLMRKMIVKAADSPATLHDLSMAAHAVNRLPLATPGVSIEIDITNRYNNESSYCGIEIRSDRLAITDGGNAYDPNAGHDSYSSTLVEMETSGFRDGSLHPLIFSGWLDTAIELLDAEADIDIWNDSEESQIDWEPLEEDPWEIYSRRPVSEHDEDYDLY